MADPLEGPALVTGPDGKLGHWVTIFGNHVFIPAASEAGKEGVKGGSRSARAKASYKKMDKDKMKVAMKMQSIVAKAVGGDMIPDNKAFDVLIGDQLVEVKTIIHATNDKITIHPESRQRKLFEGTKKTRWALVIDVRTTDPKMYLFNALGSFRLGQKHQAIPSWAIKHVLEGFKK